MLKNPKKNKLLYFISAESHQQAAEIAKEHDIQPNCWKYVPLKSKDRLSVINGYHGIPKENLIGYFDKEETLYLTMKVEDDKPKEEPVKEEVKEKPNLHEEDDVKEIK